MQVRERRNGDLDRLAELIRCERHAKRVPSPICAGLAIMGGREIHHGKQGHCDRPWLAWFGR
jgi:hypothetical protein